MSRPYFCDTCGTTVPAARAERYFDGLGVDWCLCADCAKPKDAS